MRLFLVAIVMFVFSSNYSQAVETNSIHTGSEAFEVATIKPVDSHGQHLMGTWVYPGGRVQLQGMSLKDLICAAFNLTYLQLSGGENWMDSEKYDVLAKPPDSIEAIHPNTGHDLFHIDDPQIRGMLQTLLVERFHLKYHLETKTGKVFLLERGKGPLRLKQVTSSNDGTGGIGFADKWVMSNMTMPQLAKFASSYYLHRPVLDKTGLSGSYDFRSEPESWESYSADTSGSFIDLIHEIGLRLEQAQGNVEVFVIDHAEQPSPN